MTRPSAAEIAERVAREEPKAPPPEFPAERLPEHKRRSVEAALAAKRSRPNRPKPHTPPASMPVFLTMKDLTVSFQVSRTSIQDWIAAGKFPRGIEFGPSSIRWRQKDVDDFITRMEKS